MGFAFQSNEQFLIPSKLYSCKYMSKYQYYNELSKPYLTFLRREDKDTFLFPLQFSNYNHLDIFGGVSFVSLEMAI